MSDELLVVSETEQLVISGEHSLEVIDTTEASLILEVAQQGPPGPAGPAGEFAGIDALLRPSYVSDHPGTLTIGMAVCLIAGKLRRATSVSPFHIPIGLVFEDTLLQGVSGRVQTDTNFTTTSLAWDAATGMVGGLATGQVYFLTATGAITPFAPTDAGSYIVPVGLALSSTTLRIGFNSPVQL